MSDIPTILHRTTISGSEVIEFIRYACQDSSFYIECISYNMLADTYAYDISCTEDDLIYIKLKYS